MQNVVRGLCLPIGAMLLGGCYTEWKGRPRPARARSAQYAEQAREQAVLRESERLAEQLERDEQRAQAKARAAEPPPAKPDPRLPRATEASFVAAGLRQTCATRPDRVVCWGRTHDPAPEGSFAKVAVGHPNACALDSQGTVRCWGENLYGALGDGTIDVRKEPVQVDGLADAIGLGVGFYASCAVRQTGAAVCWGRNHRGALGDGTETTHRTPTPVVGLPPVAEIVGGEDFFCARTRTGDVHCWGDGRLGQGGDGKMGDKAEKRKPTKVPGLAGVVSLAAGRHHVCAADTPGTVRCWGLGVHGVLGPKAIAASGVPVVVPDLDEVVEVAAAETFSCARRRNGEVWCWGNVPGVSNERGATNTKDARPLTGFVDSVQIAASESSVCARHAKGEITCTGR